MRLFLDDAWHVWGQAFLREKAFVLFLCTVAVVTAVRVGLLIADLRRPSDDTWRRCAAHVRSMRGLLCLTLLATAWFASLDWFTIVDEEFDHRSRQVAVAAFTVASRLATRLTLPVLVATLICLAWIASDWLQRRRRRLAGLACADGRVATVRGVLCLILLVTLLAALEPSVGSFFPYVSDPDASTMFRATWTAANRLALMLPLCLVICVTWLVLDAVAHRRAGTS